MTLEYSIQTLKTSVDRIALYYAVMNGNIELVELLVRNGNSDYQTPDMSGKTLIDYARDLKYQNIVEFFMNDMKTLQQ